jgi:ferritin-like metal-binding protein YciE
MSATSARDLFVTGLRNAHAMERQAQELLERQSERSGDYPEVQARLRQHLAETRTQLSRLEECLKACGESPSALKDAALAFGANVAAMGHAVAPDEIIKNALANNAFEHYEIAAYKSLLSLAEPAGMSSHVASLRTSLAEEEQMAAWVDQSVKTVTLAYLAKSQRTAA